MKKLLEKVAWMILVMVVFGVSSLQTVKAAEDVETIYGEYEVVADKPSLISSIIIDEKVFTLVFDNETLGKQEEIPLYSAKLFNIQYTVQNMDALTGSVNTDGSAGSSKFNDIFLSFVGGEDYVEDYEMSFGLNFVKPYYRYGNDKLEITHNKQVLWLFDLDEEGNLTDDLGVEFKKVESEE